jgi:type II secretory pathway component GspD/PulD (secretin)
MFSTRWMVTIAALALAVLGTVLFGHWSLSAQPPASDPKPKPEQPEKPAVEYREYKYEKKPVEYRKVYDNEYQSARAPSPDERLAAMEKHLDALTQEVKALRQELKKARPGSETTIPLKYVDAAGAAKALQAFFGERNVQIGVDHRANALTIQAKDADLVEIRKVVGRLDAPAK